MKDLRSSRGALSQPASPCGNRGLRNVFIPFDAGTVTNVVVVPIEQVDSLFLNMPLP